MIPPSPTDEPVFTEPKYKNPAAIAWGRRGGRSTSARKAAAARANGKKGGRPRLTDQPLKKILQLNSLQHQ